MNELTVKIRKVRPHAITPTYGTAGAACFDLYAAEDVIIAPGETVAVPVGFAVELPEGYELQIRPRSGITLKTKLRVANAPGTVDADYRGEVAVIIDNISQEFTLIPVEKRNVFNDWYYDVSGKKNRDGTRRTIGTYIIRKNDRIAQAAIIPVPQISFIETKEELTQTERGDGAFGSTGVN